MKIVGVGIYMIAHPRAKVLPTSSFTLTSRMVRREGSK